MQIIDLETGASTTQVAPLSIALGTFDGVHAGHIALIRECQNKPQGTQSAVFTFEKNPFGVPYVYTLEEKLSILRSLGVKYACICDFDTIKDVDYVTFQEEIIFGKLGARKIVCGYDFRYGKGADGNFSTLRDACTLHGAEIKVIDKVTLDGVTVSSTAIRKFLAEGDLKSASKFLTRPYSITGTVEHGNEIGHKNGYPTINQYVGDGRCPIRRGVYVSRVLSHGGMTNIGFKPTVGSDKLLCETNIFDFDADVYGQTIKTELIDFVRDEAKFDSVDKLFEQLSRDKQICMEILQEDE